MKARQLFLWVPGLIALILALLMLLPPGRTRGFDLAAFGRLPVLQGGRVKPMDSVARNALLLIRSKQSARFEGRTLTADEWLLDVLFRPQVADAQPVFVIDDPDVLGAFGIPQSSNRYFSFAQLTPHLAEVQQQAQAASRLAPAQRTRSQGALLELFNRLFLYHQLRNTLQLADSPGLLAEIQSARQPGAESRHQALAQFAYFRALPPLRGQDADHWLTIGEGLDAPEPHPALALFGRAGAAYASGDAQGFGAATADLQQLVLSERPEAQAKANHEFLFNQAEPFYSGMVIYVLALLTLFISWIWKPERLQPAAYSLLIAGLLIHTAGLISRILLQGRPPVTNLYSSAIFVGWVAVVLGVVLEKMYRRGFATAVAAVAGFASLIVAQHLSGGGDTMEMMVAVLDSNFWLATHVVTITIGYGGTFLAGAIAIAYTLRKHLVLDLDEATSQALLETTYGILCFSLFFSFLGTVLGGIWADQSWGRFWGWDPKENGALLIVLWNALILHARAGGHAQERGIMAMAIGGTIFTALAWFGVNMLGVGLHSYGFTDKGFLALLAFVLVQLTLVGLCLLPARFWTPSPQPGTQKK